MSHSALASLRAPFRERFLSFTELEAQLRAWTEAFPHLARLNRIGSSGEGRPLWVLSVGREPEGHGPAVWVDANMHAAELAGSSVALGIAEDVLDLHLPGGGRHLGLPDHVLDVLREVTFHVMPRLSPDGAEAVLDTGRWVRSVPRDPRDGAFRPRWVAQDLDGDGLALWLRRRSEVGDLVELPGAPGVMVPRELHDPGPYYQVFPEGIIEGFDGRTIPDPHYLSDNWPDLNRNFPCSWRAEPDQEGAGDFPGSEPEARAVIEFATARPEIFAWLNLHTFGGVFIRPLGHAPDSKLDPHDLAVFRQVEEWNREHTGYPTVSGFEQFTYEPEKPLHGDLTDYAYEQRGALAYVCELWDLFEELKLPRTPRFVERYTRFTRRDAVALFAWDREKNRSRLFRPWRPVIHPQLGEVEVGGFDPRVGLWNPPLERLGEVCRNQALAFLRVAALAPRIRVALTVEPAGPGLSLVSALVQNQGYLASHGLSSARRLPWNRPLVAELAGLPVVGPDGSARQEVGHLGGWGAGRFGASFHFPRSSASGERVLTWLVRGSGRARVTVRGPRVGAISAEVDVP